MLDCVISHLGVTCEKKGPYPSVKQAGLSGHAWLASSAWPHHAMSLETLQDKLGLVVHMVVR